MEAANALEKYFQRVRRRFPPGFSKYFYTEDRTKEEREGLDETLKDEFLFTIREEAMKMQSNNKKVTYLKLVRKFGWPLTLAISLLWVNLPEEIVQRFKKICRCFCVGAAVCVIIGLSVFSVHVSNIQADVSITERKTTIVQNGNDVSGSDKTEDYFEPFDQREVP